MSKVAPTELMIFDISFLQTGCSYGAKWRRVNQLHCYLRRRHLIQADLLLIEAVKIHHLGPRRYKVMHELLLRVCTSVDFS